MDYKLCDRYLDCKLCYRYLKCWACDEWMGCKGKKAEAECFVCDQAVCPGRTGDARPYEGVE